MSSHATLDMSDHMHHGRTRLTAMSWFSIGGAAVIFGALILLSVFGSHGHDGHAADAVPHAPHLWQLGILPFIGILGCIAVLPLISATQHWWESNQNRLAVALVCAFLTLAYYVTVAGEGLDKVGVVLEHAIVAEYIPFIVLLFSLYVVSGGISLRGDLQAKPLTNTTFLAVGAGLASFIGTTGASMLLIRPLLQTNSERKRVVHTVVFFIFLVSNIGGTLLPIGDPPLFLGYLYGVPFFWTLNLWLEWLVCCVILLAVYYVWDTMAYKKETPRDILRDDTQRKPLRLDGALNFVFLLGVVLAVAFINPDKPLWPGVIEWHPFPFLRELIMLAMVGLSLKMTARGIRERNQFNYHAILEVAALFLGIFVAMQVPLEVLKAIGEQLPVSQPWHFFWATGGLSSFLDNAPTYVVFFELGKVKGGTDMLALHGGDVISVPLLIAVSLGSVFMGAMTYIGNGPNFMVKSIAEQSGVKMPSFFGYMFKYSLPILVPIFVVIMVLFLL